MKLYVIKLSTIFNVFWLNRNGNRFIFFDESLISISSNIYSNIICLLLSEFINVINHDIKIVDQQIMNQYNLIIQKWKFAKKKIEKFKFFVENWFMKIRQCKILSIFSPSNTHTKTRELTFIDEKIMKNDWIKICHKKLYKLKRIECFYEKYIKNICNTQNCFKIRKIQRLIFDDWKSKEKTIFIIMTSTNILIFYWIRFTQKPVLIKKTTLTFMCHNFCEKHAKSIWHLFMSI